MRFANTILINLGFIFIIKEQMKNPKILLRGLACAFLVVGTFFYYKHQEQKKIQLINAAKATEMATSSDAGGNAKNNYKLTCQQGYKMIKPLLSANQKREYSGFTALKAKIGNLIEDNKKNSVLSSASVYLYNFNDGKWLSVNPDESYNPGSLIKLPMLITYLKESENDPALLNRKFTFEGAGNIPTQTFTSASVKKGNSYTVNELLHYMIANSDNNATKLLNEHVVIKDFVKTFTDIQLPEPNVSDRNYQITAKNYSNFFVVLYYATYISKANSERAMELLSECDFKDGMLKELPANLKVAHKFGEWGDNRIGLHELHEAGVVYLNNKPYLLTVMTKGSNTKDLSTVITRVSKLVYDEFSAPDANQPNM